MDPAALDEQQNNQRTARAKADRPLLPSASENISDLPRSANSPGKKPRSRRTNKTQNESKEPLRTESAKLDDLTEVKRQETTSRPSKPSQSNRLPGPEETVAVPEEESKGELEGTGITERKATTRKKAKKWLHVASLVHVNGFLIETIYNLEKNPPLRHKLHMGKPRPFGSAIEFGTTPIAPPISNGMVESGTILLASGVAPYGSQKQLVAEIKEFIRRYADVPEFWEEIIAHYILMTWVYDRFTAVAYLRFLSEPGTGKSRLLQIIVHLVYKGISASGAITASPLFRLMELWGGTLVIDEADFKDSDAWAEIVKILNCGYMRGVPVIRSERVGGTYEPRSFDPFGPKIIANRSRFQDPALESRCITLEGEEGKLRADVPRQLPPQFFEEAGRLRNKLLQWRFDNFDRIKADESQLLHLEPRLAQIGTPIYSVSDDPEFRKRFLDFLSERGAEERSERPQAVVVEAIKELVKFDDAALAPSDGQLTVKSVTDRANKINETRGMGEAMSAKKVGGIIRSLGFKPKRKQEGYMFPVNPKRLAELVGKYLPVTGESEDGGNG